MRARRILRKIRRGMTLPEVLISAFIMLGIVLVLTQFARINNILWQKGVAESTAVSDSQQAIQRLAPYIRKARRVVDAGTNTITLQLPEYEADGDLVIPLADGDEVKFYLSDSTGSEGSTGNILWMSVNGTPDTSWSMGTQRGRVLLSALTFTYVPAADPESVVVTVSSTKEIGTTTQQVTTSQEVVLRNKLDEE